MLGKVEGRRRKGETEDKVVGWHHWLIGHEFEQSLEDMKDSEAWHAVVHELTKIQTRLRELATEQQLIKLKKKKKMESNLESSLSRQNQFSHTSKT